ncbi:MAG: hypothetical protein ABS84_14740 [Rubrivivax sp. SCN 71-131]|nr:MAG: hypothetical protein ABS84_14740 [Rubrivivax sp. SCN 71-131]
MSAGIISPIVAVRLWGIDWTCSFDGNGRLRQVRVAREWLDAREALRDTLVQALERAYAEMPS